MAKQSSPAHAKKKTAKRALGDLGEDIAARFLTEKGYKVRERNFLTRWGELDIVAQRGDTIHFVEVKTAHISSTGPAPEEHITHEKLARLEKAIDIYLSKRRLFEYPYQLDAIIVVLDVERREARINHMANVF